MVGSRRAPITDPEEEIVSQRAALEEIKNDFNSLLDKLQRCGESSPQVQDEVRRQVTLARAHLNAACDLLVKNVGMKGPRPN